MTKTNSPATKYTTVLSIAEVVLNPSSNSILFSWLTPPKNEVQSLLTSPGKPNNKYLMEE